MLTQGGNIDGDRFVSLSQNHFYINFTDLLRSTWFAFFALIPL